MTTTIQLPVEIAAFVRAEVAGGAAANEAEFLRKAIELYRELKLRHQDLRSQLQISMEQADRGEIAPLDMESIKAKLGTELHQQGWPR
jgi:Arc/MetJ-type ribon-helix-helix transcriptional regulator